MSAPDLESLAANLVDLTKLVGESGAIQAQHFAITEKLREELQALQRDHAALLSRVGRLERAIRRDPAAGPKVTIDLDVIERLGETEDTAEIESRVRGQEYGEEWAKHAATKAQLRRLKELRDFLSPDVWDDQFEPLEESDVEGFEPPEDSLTVGHRFCCLILGEVVDEVTASEFWTLHLGNLTDDPDEARQQVQGFCEAAIAVFELAEPQL